MFSNTEKLMRELVKISSDTFTKTELDVAVYMNEWFSKLEYYKKNKEHYGLYMSLKDGLKRKISWAMVKGSGKETVILINHLDTVDTLDFGKYQKDALDPEKTRENLKNLKLSEEVEEDLKNDDWIFGRGVADMKLGGAIQMEIIKHYSELKDFKGNVIYLSVPDEENLSVGMRSAIDLLKELKDKYNLNYTLAIDSETHLREDEKEYVYYSGSVGKLLTTVYVTGKKTHFGDIFQGINPSYILSKIVNKTEMNTYFCDKQHGVISPAPAWGFVRDFKERYDVSLPESAGGYLSFLTLKRTPDLILEELREFCIEGVKEVYEDINKNYKIFKEDIEANFPLKPRVVMYDELVKEAKLFNEDMTNDLLREIKEEIKQLFNDGKISLAEANFKFAKGLLEMIPNKTPTVVISLAPPYYPHVSRNDCKNKVEIDELIVNYMRDKYGMKAKDNEIYMGISDLSYVDFQGGSEKTIDVIEGNMPLWGEFYSVPLETMKELSIPGVNIGPWGKDLHKITERANRKDIEKTESLIKHIIDNIT